MYVVVIQNRYKEIIGCYGPFDSSTSAAIFASTDWADNRTATVCMVHYAKSKRGK